MTSPVEMTKSPNNKTTTSRLTNLPDTLLLFILTFLDVRNALSVRRVSKRFLVASTEGLAIISYYSDAAKAMGHTILPPGSLATTSQFWAVEARWRSALQPGPVVSTICGHKGSVTCLAYRNDDVLVSGSDDSSILVWAVDDPFKKSTRDNDSPTGASGTNNSANTSTRLQQQHHKQSNIRNVNRRLALNGHGGPVWAVAVLDRGTMDDSVVLSGSFDKTIKVWSLVNGNCVQTIRGHAGWVTELCTCPQMPDTVVSGSSDGTIRVFSVSHGTQLARFAHGGDSEIVYSLDWCKHSRKVASGGHRSIVYIHDLEIGAPIVNIMSAHAQKIYSVHFVENESPNMLITGGCDMLAKLWDMRASIQDPMLTLEGHTAAVTGVSSVGLYRIATCSTDRCVKVWDARIGTIPEEAGRWLGRARHATTSSTSGTSTNKSSPGRVGCVNTLFGHSEKVFSVVCHADKITSGGADQTIKIYRFNT